MPGFTLGELISQVREKIDDLSQDYFTNDEIKLYLNKGVKDLGFHLQIKKKNTVSPASSFSSVSFSDLFGSDIMTKVSAVYVSGERYRTGSLDEVKSGKEKMCVIWDGEVLFPEGTIGDVEVYYMKTPDLFSADGDTTDIPIPFQDALVDFASAECKEKEEEYGQAQALRNKYEQRKAEIIREIEEQSTDNDVSYVQLTYLWEG